MGDEPETTNGVTKCRETENKTLYQGRMYQIRIADKGLVRMAEKNVDIYEVIAKRARLQKDVTIPAPQELSQYYAADLDVLTTAVTTDVEAKRHTLTV
jgi:hypothetical protein